MIICGLRALNAGRPTSGRPTPFRCCGQGRTSTARGPVYLGVDIRESTLRTYVNGAVVQEGPIAEMTFPIDYILADLCRHITLLPGDVILTGTPANSRPMQLGDVVEVEVTGVGRLTNTVAECPAPSHAVGHQAQQDTEGILRVAYGGDWWPIATPRGSVAGGVDAVPSPS